MHENFLRGASIHYFREPLKIRSLRRFEIHGNVDVSHPLRGNQIAFIRHGIVGSRQREIDDKFKSFSSQSGKIIWLRHSAGGEPIINVKEISDVIQFHNGATAVVSLDGGIY